MMFSGSLGLDGFTDWAYDAWVEDPLKDTTHSSFQAGDCFMVYPSYKESGETQSHLSIRSEKYGEGIRDINKLYQMRDEYPELEDDINALFATVQSNYDYDVVENEPGWAYNNGRPSQWISEEGREDILQDVDSFKQGVYEISKKYASLTGEDETVYVDKIEISDQHLTMTVGEQVTIDAKISPENADNKTLIWNSEDINIAKVENGRITATGSGQTVISVQSEDGHAKTTIDVTVKEKEMQPETVDKDNLYTLLERYSGYQSNEYTQESWDAFINAYEQPKIVYQKRECNKRRCSGSHCRIRKSRQRTPKEGSANRSDGN